ncbi:MAG: phytoene desaturase family protein [Acidimicrobiia bacterium]
MRVRAVLGRVGLPATLGELTSRRWDVVVVGGGHNGLAAAAYLALAGRSVLVLERREAIGGACTLERPFADPGYQVSPCAYVIGLLHHLVVEELDLRRHGYRVHPIDPHLWCPFEDGTSLSLWDEPDRSAAAVALLSPGDVDGYRAYEEIFLRIRQALRSPIRDTWVGPAPQRDELEALLGHDREAVEVLFESSIAEVVERHVTDERLRTALHGQGIIGTWAGPRDPGTAAIHAFHAMGTLDGRAGAWGFVSGGAGQVSFALAEAAIEAGATVASGVPVSAIAPGEGVRLEGGEFVRAQVVVSNADAQRTLELCEGEVPVEFEARVRSWNSLGCVVKVNCGLTRLPRFSAASDGEPGRGMVTVSSGIDSTQAAYVASRRGEPAPDWCELYLQTVYDPSVAPPGRHLVSVFAQYAPYVLAQGSWEERRGSASPAGTSSRGNACPTRCGTGASAHAPRFPGSTCAARPPIREEASSPSTDETRRWRCWRISGTETSDPTVGRCAIRRSPITR